MPYAPAVTPRIRRVQFCLGQLASQGRCNQDDGLFQGAFHQGGQRKGMQIHHQNWWFHGANAADTTCPPSAPPPTPPTMLHVILDGEWHQDVQLLVTQLEQKLTPHQPHLKATANNLQGGSNIIGTSPPRRNRPPSAPPAPRTCWRWKPLEASHSLVNW